MFNAMRAKLVALAAFAASLVRGDEAIPNRGPQSVHMADPSFRKIESRRPRKGRARCGHEIEAHMYHDSKLGKRFAEAAYRSCRGY
jgi:hypothetical protein